MTTQSYTNFAQTHHIFLVNFQRKKIKIVYIKEMTSCFSGSFVFLALPAFFPPFLLSLPKIGGRQPPFRPLS